MIWGHTLLELFAMGGPVMWPLLLCSVVALAIVVERAIVIGRVRGMEAELVEDVAGRLGRGDRAGAAARCNGRSHPVAALARAFVSYVDVSREVREEVLQREGGLQLEALETRLSPLRLVAQVAPVLGLLGTVVGLVGAFWQLEQATGPVEPKDLAAGIWSALLTTVFGLSIAIPASAAHHLLQDRVDAIGRGMAFAVARLDEARESASRRRAGA